MASAVRAAVVQRLLVCVSLVLPFTRSASAAECAAGGSSCSAYDANPIPGDALLQRDARRQGSHPSLVEKHRPEHHVSMMQMNGLAADFGELGLPAGAAALFNKRFCQRRVKRSQDNASTNSSQTYLFAGSDSTSNATRKAALGKLKPQGLPGSSPGSKLDQTSERSHVLHQNSLQRQGKAIPFGAEKRTPRNAPSFTRAFLDQWDSSELPGLQASIDESGFEKVAALNSSEQMKMYVRRVAYSCNLKVINDGGLNGAIAWFNGTQEAGGFNKLKIAMFKALLAPSKDHWVAAKHEFGVSGNSATLDLVGYVQVRALRNAKHMTTFVRRMLKNMGLRITDEDGFNGLMRYYSEPDDSEGFEKLMLEIKKAAYEHSWLELE